MRKIRQRIVKTVTLLAVFGEVMFMTALDSNPWLAAVGCGICGVWLILFFIANCVRD